MYEQMISHPHVNFQEVFFNLIKNKPFSTLKPEIKKPLLNALMHILYYKSKVSMMHQDTFDNAEKYIKQNP